MAKILGVIVSATFLLAACGSDNRGYTGNGYRSTNVKPGMNAGEFYRRQEAESGGDSQ